jgi:hypothetical protein
MSQFQIEKKLNCNLKAMLLRNIRFRGPELSFSGDQGILHQFLTPEAG